MLRLIKLLFLAVLMIAIIVLALANREMVTLNVLPEGIKNVLPLSVDVPMFAVILVSILVGLLIGYILEWLREHKHRRLAAQKNREAAKLKGEVETLKKKHMSPEDEVLAILDNSPGRA
ncbi:lipopolysaccharide assembly protein LapA domain-containing protein [Oceanibium sediminis]|uniref:lipopolysaccharide assembly protein LapA domain-containing protein n=1 Tax=Oceanibium sediminis TaxID=2026339 RepID=UPI000DD34CA6|nr:LapA family protein [Oceanibium sediminis]